METPAVHRSTIPLLVVLGLLLVMPSGIAANDDPLTAAERAWYDEHGPIRYAPDPDYPPFEWTDADGEHAGINFDFLNRISRNLDIEFEIVDYQNWTAVLEGKKAGEVDMLGALAQTSEREEYMDFVGPYMEVGEVFFVTDTTRYQTVADLIGARVGVVENYAAADWLSEHHPELELVSQPDMLSGLEALALGNVDAFFENIPVAGYYIRQNSLDTIQIMGEPSYYSPANWGYTKDNALLGAIIQKGMDSIPLGEQVAIFAYWTGNDLSVRRAIDDDSVPLWALTALVAVTGAAVVGGAFSLMLQRQVTRKTAHIAHQKKKLIEANRNLEARVRERTQELELVHDHLGMVNQAIEDTLESGVHAFGRLQRTLENRYHGILSATTRQQLVGTSQEVSRIARLLVNLHAMDAATGRSASLETIKIAPVVADVITRMRAQDPGRELSIHVPADLEIHSDRRLIEAIFENLVSNAWQATAKTPNAQIRVGAEAHGANTRFFVEDNGCGMPAEIAAAYASSDPASISAQGTHLGLLATARAVHFLGGDIRFEPTTGGGTRAWFTLGGAWDHAPGNEGNLNKSAGEPAKAPAPATVPRLAHIDKIL